MQRKIAFTLIELLVCFAIIAILAAIIFSVLAAGKDKTRQSVCLSNMRQIHAAVMLYRQDYDGSDSGTSVSQLGLPKSIEGLPQWGYIKTNEIMWCPNRVLTEYGRQMKNDHLLWSYEDYSEYKYYYNFAKKYNEDHKWPLFLCKFEDISNIRKNPSQTPQMVSVITLDGNVYRFAYEKIQKLGGAGKNEVQDEIYR